MNNAGTSQQNTLETSAPTDLDFMFNTHVRSVFTITKRAMPHLKKSKGMYVTLYSHVSIDAIIISSLIIGEKLFLSQNDSDPFITSKLTINNSSFIQEIL